MDTEHRCTVVGGCYVGGGVVHDHCTRTTRPRQKNGRVGSSFHLNGCVLVRGEVDDAHPLIKDRVRFTLGPGSWSQHQHHECREEHRSCSAGGPTHDVG